MKLRLVIVESPYAASHERSVAENKHYTLACMNDCMNRGEAPFASHVLYTEALDDNIPQHRELGINCGLAWGRLADMTVVYIDFGVSRGMQLGIKAAMSVGRPIEFRRLYGPKAGVVPVDLVEVCAIASTGLPTPED